MKLTIESLMAEDELVAVTGKVVGTNQGSMMGAPATGKRSPSPTWTCIES